jgi:hypothetical protein
MTRARLASGFVEGMCLLGLLAVVLVLTRGAK